MTPTVVCEIKNMETESNKNAKANRTAKKNTQTTITIKIKKENQEEKYDFFFVEGFLCLGSVIKFTRRVLQKDVLPILNVALPSGP